MWGGAYDHNRHPIGFCSVEQLSLWRLLNIVYGWKHKRAPAVPHAVGKLQTPSALWSDSLIESSEIRLRLYVFFVDFKL